MDALPEKSDDDPDTAVIIAPGSGHAAVHRAEDAAYAAFPLPDEELLPVPQVQALLKEPEIAAYLKSGGGPTSRRVRRIGAFFLVSLAVLLLVYWLPPWNMLYRYRPPRPAETLKPTPYAGGIPLLFRDRIRSINDDIAAGDRWGAVFGKLSSLVDDIDAGKVEAPKDMATWARSETLVAMASKEVPPTAYAESYPETVFAGFMRPDPRNAGTALPYRAGAAYVRLLQSAPRGKDNAGEAERRVQEAFERLRSEHGRRVDADGDLLAIEAHNHIAAIPKEYTPNDRLLDYHWRRAANAIDRLYALHGKNDPQARSLDRSRWQAVFRYFDLTLLTWDVDRLGWRKTVTLDGAEYTRDDVKKILERL